MEYREIPPGPQLAPYVAAIWTLRGASTALHFDLVLPDGHAEIVIHRTGRFREWRADGRTAAQASAIIVGVMEQAVALAPAASFETVGVRFEPAALARLCAARPEEMAARITPADQLARPPLAAVLAAAADAESLDSAVACLQQRLPRVLADAAPARPYVVAAARRIRASGGTVPIDRIVRESGASARSLERGFLAAVGMSPKRYARVVRFHRAAGALLAGAASTTEVALTHGYYDQAHLTRDVKAFTGWAPGALVAGRLGELARHFVRASPVADSSKTGEEPDCHSGAQGGLP